MQYKQKLVIMNWNININQMAVSRFFRCLNLVYTPHHASLCWFINCPSVFLMKIVLGARMLECQTGQISKKFYFFRTIYHFLAPFGVLTPTSILNFVADFFFLVSGPSYGLKCKLRGKKYGFDFLDFWQNFEIFEFWWKIDLRPLLTNFTIRWVRF